MTLERPVVIDANIVVKLFIGEEFSLQAEAALRAFPQRIAPDLLPVEVGNVFLKKRRLGQIDTASALRALASIPEIVTLRTVTDLYESAFSLAALYERSFYDALYVALALREECQLLTADQRLCNALRPHLGETMLWLGDLPAAV